VPSVTRSVLTGPDAGSQPRRRAQRSADSGAESKAGPPAYGARPSDVPCRAITDTGGAAAQVPASRAGIGAATTPMAAIDFGATQARRHAIIPPLEIPAR